MKDFNIESAQETETLIVKYEDGTIEYRSTPNKHHTRAIGMNEEIAQLKNKIKQLRKVAKMNTSDKEVVPEYKEVSKETKELRDKLESFLDKCYFYNKQETGLKLTFDKEHFLKGFDEIAQLDNVDQYIKTIKDLSSDKEDLQLLYVSGYTTDKGMSIYAYEIIEGEIYALQDSFLDLPR